MQKITFHTDGACSGNPGPGGWAVVMEDGMSTSTLKGGAPQTTNNIMEMTAALEAMKWAKTVGASDQGLEITIRMDSEYVRKGLTEWMPGWKRRDWRTADGKPVKNKELWLELNEAYQALKLVSSVALHHVKGHAGDPGNELADSLAVEARDISRDRTEIWSDSVKGRMVASEQVTDSGLIQEGLARGYRAYQDTLNRGEKSYETSLQLKVRDERGTRYFLNIDFFDFSKLGHESPSLSGEVHLQFHEKDDMEGDHINLRKPFISFEDAEIFAQKSWLRLSAGHYNAFSSSTETSSAALERFESAIDLLLDVVPEGMSVDDITARIEAMRRERMPQACDLDAPGL